MEQVPCSQLEEMLCSRENTFRALEHPGDSISVLIEPSSKTVNLWTTNTVLQAIMLSKIAQEGVNQGFGVMIYNPFEIANPNIMNNREARQGILALNPHNPLPVANLELAIDQYNSLREEFNHSREYFIGHLVRLNEDISQFEFFLKFFGEKTVRAMGILKSVQDSVLYLATLGMYEGSGDKFKRFAEDHKASSLNCAFLSEVFEYGAATFEKLLEKGDKGD